MQTLCNFNKEVYFKSWWYSAVSCHKCFKKGTTTLYSYINEVLNKWNYTWSVNNLHNTITWIYETNCLYIFNLVLSIGRIFFLLSWIIYLTFFKNQIIKNRHNWYWGCSIAFILKRKRNKGCVFFFTFFLSGWSDTN